MKQELIEKALALTGKTIGYVSSYIADYDEGGFNGEFPEFSIEKFCYYLLSPEFIEKYKDIYFPIRYGVLYNRGSDVYLDDDIIYTAEDIGICIYEYQSGNEQPLEDLLSKI